MRNYIIGFIIGVAVCLCVLLSFRVWQCLGRRATVAGGETEIVLDSVYIARSVQPVHITGHANSFVFRAATKANSHIMADSTLQSSQPMLNALLPFKSPLFPPTAKDSSKLLHTKSPFAVSLNGKLFTPTSNSKPDFPGLFTARLDTIFRFDTISIRYDYPENLFTFSLHPRPDSVLFKQIVVRPKPEPWWVKPVLIISGCVAGVIIGRSVSN